MAALDACPSPEPPVHRSGAVARTPEEYCDFRDLQAMIVGTAIWPAFEARFGTKEGLERRFSQLAELRNSIPHSRAVTEVARVEGEAALPWFGQAISAD
jgi:hypothetical protein